MDYLALAILLIFYLLIRQFITSRTEAKLKERAAAAAPAPAPAPVEGEKVE